MISTIYDIPKVNQTPPYNFVISTIYDIPKSRSNPTIQPTSHAFFSFRVLYVVPCPLPKITLYVLTKNKPNRRKTCNMTNTCLKYLLRKYILLLIDVCTNVVLLENMTLTYSKKSM
jgi:hypothetical protein